MTDRGNKENKTNKHIYSAVLRKHVFFLNLFSHIVHSFNMRCNHVIIQEFVSSMHGSDVKW